jgi:hypothetical protein
MTNNIHLAPDRMQAAESVFTLLARLDISKFPWEERIGVAVCQARAMRDWIEAVRSAKARLRFERLFVRQAPGTGKSRSIRTSLSSFLVDRSNPQRQ